MVRTVEQWMEILEPLSPEKSAEAVLGDIVHYREGGSYERDDRQQLINAMHAMTRIAVIRN